MISTNKYKHLAVDLSTHLIVTSILSLLIYKFYSSFILVVLVVIGGILIDLDHFIDYFSHYGFKFDLKKFVFIGYLKSGKIYVYFHSWELIILIYITGLFFGWGKYSMALSLGMLGHLIIDSTFRKAFLPYSLFYRMWYNFDAYKILPRFKNIKKTR